MRKNNMKDFSPESIKKAVLHNSLTHPFLLAFALVGIFGVLGFFLFKIVFLIILGLSGFVLVGATFSFNYYFRRPQIESEYIQMLSKRAEDNIRNKLDELNHDLDLCLDFSDNDPLVMQANKQFRMVNDKFNSFKDILSKKFNPDELTYGRFYTTAEQTHGAVLDNLEKVVLSFKVLKDIDLEYLETRYDELKKRIDSNTAEDFDKKEFESIQERIDMREKKFYEIDSILSKNEEAMTEMNKINLKLSEIRTHEGRSHQDLDDTLVELNNLANTASQYEIQ